MKPVITPSSSTESVNKVPVVKAKATHVIMNSLITSKNSPLTLSSVCWALRVLQLGGASGEFLENSWVQSGSALVLCAFVFLRGCFWKEARNWGIDHMWCSCVSRGGGRRAEFVVCWQDAAVHVAAAALFAY